MSAPIGFTCPKIDSVISDITDVYKNLYYTEEMTIEDLQGIIQEASSSLYTFTSEINSKYNPLEDLRESNDTLRNWGEGLEEDIKGLEKERDDLIDQNATLQYTIDNEMWDLKEEVKSLQAQLQEAIDERNRIQSLFENEFQPK